MPALKKRFAGQGKSVGMHAGRGESDNDIAGGDALRIGNLALVNDPDRKSGEIKVAGFVDPGHLRRLAAE